MPERAFLDSNVLFWFAFEPDMLSERARQTIIDPDVLLLTSPFAIVEFGWKAGLGKISFADPVADWIAQQRALLGAREVPFTSAHAAMIQDLAWHHRDPFDRMLIAQAIVEDAAILTSDRVFVRYPVEVVW